MGDVVGSVSIFAFFSSVSLYSSHAVVLSPCLHVVSTIIIISCLCIFSRVLCLTFVPSCLCGVLLQVARLQSVAYSQRMGTSDASSGSHHAAAAMLPASRVLEVVQAQGHQVAQVAEKLARMHARAEALRLRVRERAAAREVVDPFKQVRDR